MASECRSIKRLCDGCGEQSTDRSPRDAPSLGANGPGRHDESRLRGVVQRQQSADVGRNQAPSRLGSDVEHPNTRHRADVHLLSSIIGIHDEPSSGNPGHLVTPPQCRVSRAVKSRAAGGKEPKRYVLTPVGAKVLFDVNVRVCRSPPRFARDGGCPNIRLLRGLTPPATLCVGRLPSRWDRHG